MTKQTIAITFPVLAVLLGLGVFVGWKLNTAPLPADARVAVHQSTALRIEEVRKLGSLVTLRVPISDVLTSEMSGWTGGVSVVLIVRGDVDVATDLEKARLEQVDAEKKTAVLVLKQPVTSRPRVDHQGTRVYKVQRSGLWSVMPGSAGEGELIDAAMKEAQGLVDRAANQPTLIEQARKQAETVLEQFFKVICWDVKIRWE